MTTYREILKNELGKRVEFNQRYSLRAFARDLKLSPSRLSEVLNGKQGLSRSVAEHVGKRLGFSNQELKTFCDLVDSEHARSRVKKELANVRLTKNKKSSLEEATLLEDQFKVISDWYHFALLELMNTKGFQSNEAWMAKRLGITPTETKLAIERLKRLNLLVEKNNKLKRAEGFWTSTSGIPSEAIKKYHKQKIEKALSALYTQSIEERDFSSVNFAIRTDRVAEAKEALKEFRRKFCQEFEKDSVRDEVYNLSIQFFKLTQDIGGES